LTQDSQTFTKYVEKPTEVCLRGRRFRPSPMGEIKMGATRGSAHYAGLLPIELSDEPLRIRPISLEENDWFENGPSMRKSALRALSYLIAFCTGVAGAFTWWSYGDAARPMIESSYQQLSRLAPRGATAEQKTPEMVAMLRDLHAMRQSIDWIAARQEQMLRSIDQIATSIAAGQDLPRSSVGETASNTAQAPAADATRITVESRTDGAGLQSAVRADIKPSEARLPQTLSERGKQLSAASGHDASCFPSASAVLQKHPGAWPSWTQKAPGHEGTMCWHAGARPNGSDHRSEMVQSKEIVRTTANALSAPPAAYTRPPE
jgi:hypothetical protein